MTLSVEIEALVIHARERLEDAYIVDALQYVIGKAGNVPSWVWGDTPPARKYEELWQTILDSRIEEAQVLRDKLAEVASGLYQVAADYAGTDIEAALTLFRESDGLTETTDKAEADRHGGIFKAWLEGMYKDDTGLKAEPGGDPMKIDFAEPPSDRELIEFADGTQHGSLLKSLLAENGAPAGDDLYESWEDQYKESLDPAGESSNSPTIIGTSESASQINFENFYDTNKSTFAEISRKLAYWGYSLAKGEDPSAFLDLAYRTWPNALVDRATILGLVTDYYKNLADTYAADLNALKGSWQSKGAARAYYEHANSILKYIHALKTEADWMATQASKAAKSLDDLLEGYHEAGIGQIENIGKQFEKFLEAEASFFDDIDEPSKLLSDAVGSLAKLLQGQLEAVVDDSKKIMDVNNRGFDAASEVGAPGHATEEFPESPLSDDVWESDSWTSGESDKPVNTWEPPR